MQLAQCGGPIPVTRGDPAPLGEALVRSSKLPRKDNSNGGLTIQYATGTWRCGLICTPLPYHIPLSMNSSDNFPSIIIIVS
jgi:hypothetical protein